MIFKKDFVYWLPFDNQYSWYFACLSVYACMHVCARVCVCDLELSGTMAKGRNGAKTVARAGMGLRL